MGSWNDVEAYNKGLRAFFSHESKVACPYPNTSPRFAIWHDGWEAGLALLQRQAPGAATARP